MSREISSLVQVRAQARGGTGLELGRLTCNSMESSRWWWDQGPLLSGHSSCGTRGPGKCPEAEASSVTGGQAKAGVPAPAKLAPWTVAEGRAL